MFFSSLLLSLSIGVIAFSAWFGILENLYCAHRADRFYFVLLTKFQHQTNEPHKKVINCNGRWQFHFDKTSNHERVKRQHSLQDWGVPHE